MKKSIMVEFHSIRNINDFYSLNRQYSRKVHVFSELSRENGSVPCLYEMQGPIEVSAEGDKDYVVKLFDSYRTCGIA